MVKITQYPRNADGTPMKFFVGVLTDTSGNNGARLTNVPIGPDGAPISSVAIIMVDNSGTPVPVPPGGIVAGASAYERALANGFVGTETQWLASLKGADSTVPGPRGFSGSTVLSDVTDPGPLLGQVGDFYINTATWTIFGPKAGTGWPAGTSLIGPGGVVVPPPVAPPDVTAPLLTASTSAASGSTTGSIGVTTNENNGTLYYVVTASATPPTPVQVENALNNLGAAALFSGSQPVTSNGTKSFNLSGLTATTTYYAYMMHKDAAGNRSLVAPAASFTTSGVGSTPPFNTVLPFFTDDTGTLVTAPLRGTALFADPGTWNPGSSAITSYTYQIRKNGAIIVDASGVYTPGNSVYTPLDDDLGGQLSIQFTAISPDGTGNATSALTSPVADPVLNTAITLTRTSASGVLPFTFTAAHPAGTGTGPNWHDNLEIFDPSTGTTVGQVYDKEITIDEFSGTNDSYWDGSYDPAPAPSPIDFSTINTNYLIRMRTIYFVPDGNDIHSPWSAWISPKDLTFGAELINPASWTPVDASLSAGVLHATYAGQLAYQSMALGLKTYRFQGPINKTGVTLDSAFRLSLGTVVAADPRFVLPIDYGASEIIRDFASDINGATAISIEAAFAQLAGDFGPFSLKEIITTPTLGTLSLSSTSFTTGTPASGVINGATSGSTIVGTSLPTGFTINSAARTWAYDGTGAAGSGTLTLTETLAGATGSPKATNIGWTYASGGSVAWTPSNLGTSKLDSDWDPNLISGSNGDAVTTFPDGGTHGHDGSWASPDSSVKPTLVTGAINGFKAIDFDGSVHGYYNLPSGMLTGRTKSAAIIVCKLKNDPPTNAAYSGPVLGNFGVEGSGLSEHHPYTDGNWYPIYASTARKGPVGSVPTTTGWRILLFVSQANDFRFEQDGTNRLTLTTNTFSANTGNAHIGSSNITYFFDGQIARILDLKDFTESDLQKAVGWAAWHFGLVSQLAAGSPYKSTAPVYP